MEKVLVIGCFGDKTGRLDGQIVKTRDIYAMLQNRLGGNYRLDKFNTLDIRDNCFLIISLIFKLFWCDTLILIPANRNLEKFFPIVFYLSKFARFKIIQLCVGGWQVDFFIGRGKWDAHPKQMRMSRKCKAFLPEIQKVNDELKSVCHFTNCEVFPNFRRIIPCLDHVNISDDLRLVWLARINKEKGYEVVFKFAELIKNQGLNINITFYGKIEDNDISHFNMLVEEFKGIVNYNGQLAPELIAKTLCDYDLMLFPTRYFTEGFPGTVLDSYISGIPVIATEWMHSKEFIIEGETGFIVPFDNPQDLFNERILSLYNNRSLLMQMKKESRARAFLYSEEKAWTVLNKYL